MSQAFEYSYGSDMLSASSVILRCAVLYKEFECQNHIVCMFLSHIETQPFLSHRETNTANTILIAVA